MEAFSHSIAFWVSPSRVRALSVPPSSIFRKKRIGGGLLSKVVRSSKTSPSRRSMAFFARGFYSVLLMHAPVFVRRGVAA